MTPDDIQALLATVFANDTIQVTGGGAKFEVTIVSDQFEGKRPVARQQMVYAVLNEHIASGEIHAVTMALSTPAENA